MDKQGVMDRGQKTSECAGFGAAGTIEQTSFRTGEGWPVIGRACPGKGKKIYLSWFLPGFSEEHEPTFLFEDGRGVGARALVGNIGKDGMELECQNNRWSPLYRQLGYGSWLYAGKCDSGSEAGTYR